MSNVTFRVQHPHQQGSDVADWQRALNRQLLRWHADDLVKVDGDYGVSTRAFTARVLYGLGIAQSAMKHGVTPALRQKVRDRKLNVWEKARRAAREGWRRKLGKVRVASPLHRVIADSWGWHPGVHDGLDLICDLNAAIYAMVNGEIVRADASGWWGLGAHASGGHPVADGDGIIILRCTENVGPFRKGMHICYGHAEGAIVKPGQVVKAGQHLGHAGFAVAAHVHLMVNANAPDSNGFVRGVGDRDPRPFYDWARKHG